jgi:hypothetical protein
VGVSKASIPEIIKTVIDARKGVKEYQPNAVERAAQGVLAEWDDAMSPESVLDMIERHIGLNELVKAHYYCDAKALKRPSFGIAKYGDKQMLLCGGRLDTNHFICPDCGKDYNAVKRTTKEKT